MNCKVAELVVMGGGYPTGRRSWNFFGSKNPKLAANVINNWEGRITFVGNDVGKLVLSGGPLMLEGPDTDPVRMAMIYYSYFRPVSSWDPLTIMYAAYGKGDLFEYGNEHGHNHINEDGSNQWINDPTSRKQHFLRLKVSHDAAAAILDEKYLLGARKFSHNKPTHNPPAVMKSASSSSKLYVGCS